MSKMTDEQYLETLQNLGLVAGFISGLDLKGFINRISQSEAIGPIIDPTLYRKAQESLNDMKQLAQKLLPIQEVCQLAVAKAEKSLGVKIGDDGSINDIGFEQ